MARHLIRSDQTLKAIRPGDPRKRISDGDGPVPASLRRRRLARLAVQLQLPRQTEAAVDGDVSGDRPGACARRWPRRRVRPSPRTIDPSHKRKDDKAAVRAQWAAEERVGEGTAAPQFIRDARARLVRGAPRFLGAELFAEDHRAAGEGCLPVARARLRLPPSRRRCSSRCCDASKPGASSRRRTGRSRTAARSSAMASRSAKRRRIPRTA